MGSMDKVRLGKTELVVSKIGFGGVPLQRLTDGEAAAVTKRCLDKGVTFFDTAIEYSNCEGRVGKAIRNGRQDLIIATKSNFGTRKEIENNLKLSLNQLGVDYIDLYQFHNISNPNSYRSLMDPSGPIPVVEDAKRSGLVKHIGITTHSMDVAKEAVKSGHFETIMFPFNFVTSEPATELLPLTRQYDVGFIAMKPLAGGLVKQAKIAFKYLLQFPDVVAIPGVQRESEIDEIVEIVEGNPQMTGAERMEMARVIAELDKKLCRRCGYCQPCPQGILILRLMDLLPFLINQPPQIVFTPEILTQIEKVTDCDKCGECEKKCPYHLPIMGLIVEHANAYRTEYQKYMIGKL
jgi:predicted aldo/keto reductase-like oxidoreductase